MFIDKQLAMSDAQVLTASAASTNYVDQGAAGDARVPLRLLVNVSLALTSAGNAATLDVTLQTDDNASFSSATTIATIAQVAEASLVAGYKVCDIPVPSGTERYLRVYYTVGTENFTAGTIDAALVMDVDSNIGS
jgi:hypothetical protein